VNQSKLDAWQICLVVTALVVLAEAGVNYLLKRDISAILHHRVRTGALGGLVVITVIAFVVALGPSLADQLSSVAAAVSAVVALWLTYRSYQSTPRSALSGTGEPEEANGNATVDHGGAGHDPDTDRPGGSPRGETDEPR
jgi:membrane protein implicated in regulation of membrane protease activity